MQKTLRSLGPPTGVEAQVVYILVMGLTGAGKSTFISVATGIDDIPNGEDGEMDGVTQDVQDYIFHHQHDGVRYEIHLIDTAGFDDGTIVDSEVLSRVANYVNMTYLLKRTLAGVLYLHDITKGKMGGVGQRNLRMLENMIGVEGWDHCILVTTKWGCTTNPQAEEQREKTLEQEEKYFGAMLRSSKSAKMARFDPKSQGTALKILKPMLKKKLAPQLSIQMVASDGPKLALGETDAGRIVADNLEKLARVEGENKDLQASRQILAQKFNEQLFLQFKDKRDELLHKQRLHRAGRWAMRTTLVAGTIAATVLTLGPGASAAVLPIGYEKYAHKQKAEDLTKMERLEKEYKDNKEATGALGDADPSWLRDRKVQSIQDLQSEGYSIRSCSSTELDSFNDATEDEIAVKGF